MKTPSRYDGHRPCPRHSVLRSAAAAVLAMLAAAVVPQAADAIQTTLPASKDNTLYELASGVSSNGAGEYMFSGRTKDGVRRRGVVSFDIAANVPAGSTINTVTLQLTVARVANNTARPTSLHRLLADWGEGTSNAAQNEGQGAPPTTNDATWIHRFYPGTFWATPGGDYTGTASATTSITGNGLYAWTSATLVADVQAWLDAPATNFGWLVRGDESVVETAKRIASRENGQASNRPALVVDYTPPGGGTTGACCHDDTCDVVTAAVCTSLGGSYLGDNTTCTPDPCPPPGTVTLTQGPIADNTLYEDAAGALSNGSGTKFIVSRNGAGLIRRGLLRFDLSSIPAGATVQSAALTLYNVESGTNSFNIALHRASASWGEGTSVATGTEDAGAPATTGDATWTRRFHPSTPWTTPGGDFNATATMAVSVANEGFYEFTSATLAADVQAWVADPSVNHGWVVRGRENPGGNALKRFESRESADPTHRPRLVVTYVANITPNGACCLPSGQCDTLTAGECAAAGGTYQGDGTACVTDLCPVVLTPYVDALPIPAVAQPVSGVPGGAAEYVIPIREVSQRLHRDLPLTRVWGYGGSYPGPTILATSGVPITVTWQNDLRDSLGALRTTHYLPVDECLQGPDMEGPTARVVTHLHGGHVPPESDGYPESTMLPGQQQVISYPNNQPPGTPWYHDHAMGITRLNVMMGMAGFYLIGDAFESALGLPSGEYEIGLAIQDRSFNPDGSFRYPAMWMEHFEGDKMLVNGKVWPYLQVKQGKYRFRMLNGCNSRFLHLSLSNGAPFTVIGTDLGLLPAPVTRTELLLGPGERQDLVIDFAGFAPGTQIVLQNDAPAPYPGEPGVGVIPNVMRFDVIGTAGHLAPVPAALRPVAPVDTSEAVISRDFTLRKGNDPCTGSMWMINDLGWDDVTEYPVLGTTEIWRFINETGVSHPMHMHLVQFQVVDRQPFTRVAGEIVPTGPPVPPAPSEAGWKDTAPVNPGEMLRVIARFEDYSGLYAYHCHMLEHEDHEMMRQFHTVAAPIISVRDTGYVEGNEAGYATFTVTLSSAVQVEARVVASTADGTALAGEDYIATQDVLVFPPGVTSQVFEVPIVGDTQAEPSETFLVNLSEPLSVALGDSVAECTIQDDDGVTGAPAPGVSAVSFLARGVPNPSSGVVTIEWGLSAAARVDLSVFDVQGRRVRRLADGEQSAGRKVASWDGRDDRGLPVASGPYLVRLRIGSQVFRTTLLRLR